jgi:hypothetical protein
MALTSHGIVDLRDACVQYDAENAEPAAVELASPHAAYLQQTTAEYAALKLRAAYCRSFAVSGSAFAVSRAIATAIVRARPIALEFGTERVALPLGAVADAVAQAACARPRCLQTRQMEVEARQMVATAGTVLHKCRMGVQPYLRTVLLRILADARCVASLACASVALPRGNP